MTLIEQLKAWEHAMTPAEIGQACAFVQAQGWKPGDEPPAYVWAQAFLNVAPQKVPATSNG
ncbi:MAG: hypothetical protein WC485_08380 [Opitutaceae bacterium]